MAMTTIRTKPYDNVTEAWLCKSKCDSDYNHVYYPTAVTTASKNTLVTEYLTSLKNSGLHITEIKHPIRFRSSFVVAINLETAKLYNYVIYQDKASNFKRNGEVIERYCFIKDYVAVNDELTALVLAPDVWTQCFLCDNVSFDPKTLVSRMHVKSDAVGEWRIPENVTATRYVQCDEQSAKVVAWTNGSGNWIANTSTDVAYARQNCMLAIFVSSVDGWATSSYTDLETWCNNGNYAGGQWDGGFTGQTVLHVKHANFCQAYSGLHCFLCSYQATRTTIEAITDQNIGNILNIVTLPQICIHAIVGGAYINRAFNDTSANCRCLISYTRGDNTERWQGYSPRNKKAWLDSKVIVKDNCGTTQTFNVCDFKDTEVYFEVVTPFAPDSSAWVIPCNYNRKCIENAGKSIEVTSGGVTHYFTPNWDYAFACSPFPNNSFTSDSYQAYLAQNGGLDNMYKQVQLSNAMTELSANQNIAQQNLSIAQNTLQANLAQTTYTNSQSNLLNYTVGQLTNKFNNLLGTDITNIGAKNAGTSAYDYLNWNYAGGKQAEQNRVTQASYENANAFAQESIGYIQQNANKQKQLNELSLQMTLSGAKAIPDSGVTGTATGVAFTGMLGLAFSTVTPCYVDAVMLDFMLDKYGYQVNEYITPGVSGSTCVNPLIGNTYHNYVQTENVRLINNGAVGETELRVLESILNNGVHLWHNKNYIRRFDLTDSKLSSVNGYTLSDGVTHYNGSGF